MKKFYIDTELNLTFCLSTEKHEDIFGDEYYAFYRTNENGTGFIDTADTEREINEMMESYIRKMYWNIKILSRRESEEAEKRILKGCADRIQMIMKNMR